MPFQTTYTQDPVRGRPGHAVDLFHSDDLTFASTETGQTDGIPPGALVVRDVTGSGTRPRGQLPLGTAQDPDAIITSEASPTGLTVYSGAQLNGVIGGTAILVPAPVSLVLDSNTDWDTTTATLVGRDQNGNQISESLAIPNDGNTTVTSTNSYTVVVSLTIPAQTGAGGLFTLGYEASNQVTKAQILGVARLDRSGEPPSDVESGSFGTARRVGRIYVATEVQVTPGEDAWVRVFATGGEVVGSWRNDGDGTDAVKAEGARFIEAPTATLAVLEVDFLGT